MLWFDRCCAIDKSWKNKSKGIVKAYCTVGGILVQQSPQGYSIAQAQ